MVTYKKQEGFENQRLLIIPEMIIRQFSSHPLIRQLYITDIGYFPQAQYHFRERKDGAQQNILIYCVHGEGYILSDGQKYCITENSVLLIPKGKPHVYASSNENPWDIYWIHFNGDMCNSYVHSETSFTLNEVTAANEPHLVSLFHTIYEALSRGYTEQNLIYASQCFGYFMASLFFMPLNTKDQTDRHNIVIEKTTGFMKSNLAKSLSLQELARYNNLSKSQLTYVFKEKTGYSPIDFFIQLKIKTACSLLDFTDLPVAEVSARIGYEDPYYFSRIFKKTMGLAPTDYRRIKKG